MQLDQDLEDKVIVAVRSLALSVGSNREIIADMSALTEATSNLPLAHLNYWERLIRNEYSSASQPAHRQKWWNLKERSRLLTWVDVFSWDGFKREKTLRTLSGPVPNSFFFTLALRRFNDWVPQVREAAREKLPIIAEQSNPIHVVDGLCATLPNWESWGRMEDQDRQVLLAILTNDSTFNFLIDRIMTSTSGPMTTILSQIGRSSSVDMYLSGIAKNSIQPSVRGRAYRSQLEGKIKWLEGREWEWTDKQFCKGHIKPVVAERDLTVVPSFKETLSSASADRSSVVRRVAAEMLIRHIDSLGADSLVYARKFAADESPSVAERGDFALRHLGV